MEATSATHVRTPPSNPQRAWLWRLPGGLLKDRCQVLTPRRAQCLFPSGRSSPPSITPFHNKLVIWRVLRASRKFIAPKPGIVGTSRCQPLVRRPGDDVDLEVARDREGGAVPEGCAPDLRGLGCLQARGVSGGLPRRTPGWCCGEASPAPSPHTDPAPERGPRQKETLVQLKRDFLKEHTLLRPLSLYTQATWTNPFGPQQALPSLQ